MQIDDGIAYKTGKYDLESVNGRLHAARNVDQLIAALNDGADVNCPDETGNTKMYICSLGQKCDASEKYAMMDILHLAHAHLNPKDKWDYTHLKELHPEIENYAVIINEAEYQTAIDAGVRRAEKIWGNNPDYDETPLIDCHHGAPTAATLQKFYGVSYDPETKKFTRTTPSVVDADSLEHKGFTASESTLLGAGGGLYN